MLGWLDSSAGPAFFIMCIGKGLLKSAYGIPTLKADLIPVDIVKRKKINFSGLIKKINYRQSTCVLLQLGMSQIVDLQSCPFIIAQVAKLML